MQNSPISFDLSKYLKGLEKRLSVVENRRPGTMYITEKIVTVDPETGVETIIGDLTEYGEERNGIKQWVNDTEPPPVPSTPIVSSNLGTISVTWDGGNANNVVQAPDFKHITVYAHAEGSTRDIGTVRSANESIILPDPPYNVTHTFTFRSVDFNGNESAPSMMSAGVMATPLVQAPDITAILDDINERYDGVITDALQLNDKLSQAELDIDNAQANLTDLETVRLPQVEANIEAAHQEIITTGAELDARLDQAETDLNAAETGLNTLKNTDLPALKQRLTNAETEITTTGAELGGRLTQAESDLSAHDTRIGQNKSDLTTLNNTTLPALNTDLTNAKNRLTTAEGELSATKNRVTTAEGTLNTLKNTTIPALNTDLSNAKSRLTTTETEITNTKTRLTEAESDLTDAFGQITAVDTKAGNAQTAASNAQTTADTAKTDAANAAGIAGSKGKVLVQSTAPAVADRNAVTLWIDTTGGANTPKRWTSGTTWVAVTDKAATDAAQAAVTAQARADSAHTAAGTAQSTADNALTMAGSKSKVFYSTSDPSGTASVGDTWRKVNASNDVIAEWRWTSGNTWLTQQITSEVISNLDVGKLTAGSAIINTAVVNKIAIQTADVIKLNASAITAGTISADRLNVTDLAARIATVIELNADRITAGTIATGRLNATEVAAAVATVIQLNASRITAGTISTDRLNATEIAARVATVIQLNASRITAGTISTDRLDVNDIAAKTASFQTVDVKNLFATTGTMSEAVINKLWADVVRSRKITTDQLLVGQGENLVPWDVNSTLPDRTSNFVSYGGGSTSPGIQAAAGVAEGNHLFMVADWVTSGTTTSTWRIMSDPSASPWTTQGFKVEPEEEFQAQIYIKAGGSYTSGMPSVALSGVWYKADGTYIVTTAGTSSSLTWLWEKREVSLKAPATAAYLHLFIRQDQPGGIRVDLPSIYRKKGASLIVDGAIAAKQIDSVSVSAEVAKFINLDVSRLVATSATMNTGVINKLWTDVVRARKITTDMMVVGSGGNHFPDPLFTDPDGWSSSSYIKTGVGRNGGMGLVVPASTGQSGTYYGSSDRLRQIPVIGGQEYRVGVWVKSSVAIPVDKVTIYVKYTTSSSSTSGSFAPNIRNTGVDGRLGAVPANTWRFLEGIAKMPDTAEQAFIGLYAESGFNAAVTFSEPSVQTASGTGLIVDGAIEAKHITASESMSAKLGEFLKLDVKDLVTTGTAKIEDAVITKLWSDVVMSKKITSDMVVIGGTNNVLVDTLFEDEAYKAFRNSRSDIVNGAWGRNSTLNLNWYGATGQPTDRSKSFYFLASSGISDKNAFIPVEPGSKWRLKAKTNSAGSGARFTARFIKLDGSTGYTGISSYGPAGIVDHSEVWTIPSDFAYVQLAIQFNTTTTSCYVYGGASMVQMSAGELIVDGAITADKILANAVESDKIKANAITADKIAVGAIKAEHISARGITADKLVVGDGSNVFPDSFMKDLESWNAASAITVLTGGYGGGNRARVQGTTGQAGGYYAFATGLEGRRPDVIPGRTYLVSCYVRPTVAVSSTSAIALYSRVYKKGDPHTGSYVFTSPSVVYNGKALAANVWTEISGQITIPAGDETSFMPGLYLQSAFPSTGYCDFSMYTLTEMVTGELVVNGAITTDKLDANAVTASKIAANTITAAEIAANAITASELAANSVTATAIVASTITGDKLAANTITAAKIAANAITASELAAGAVKAENIAADAITGKTISGGTITGATVQTATSGARILINSSGVSSYTSGGNIGTKIANGNAVFWSNDNKGFISMGATTSYGGNAMILFDRDGNTSSGAIIAGDPYTNGGPYMDIEPPMRSGDSQPGLRLESRPYAEGGATLDIDAETINLSPRGDAVTSRPITFRAGLFGATDDVIWKARRLKLYGGDFLEQADLVLNNDSSGSYVQSDSTYRRTYSGSAAMCITGSGVFGRTTSALKYKEDVALVDTTSYEDALLGIEHKSWVDKAEATRYREYLEWEVEHPMQPIPHEMLETPTAPPKRHYGAIADEFHDAGLGQFVIYDSNGEVDGLAYERIGVALLPIVRTLKSRVSALEDSYESQKQLIVDLTSRLSVLESGSTP